MKSWNGSKHHCQWQGITCDSRHQRITTLSLPGKGLLGIFSPHIGNLTFLKVIYLQNNRLFGEIPQEIGFLSRLRVLNLGQNTLGGNIPVNLSRCLNLKYLNLKQNKLQGRIPIELGSLKNIIQLYLSENSLTGEIPSSFGNLSSIQVMSLSYNNLVGGLPEKMGLLTKLSSLNVGVNNITGEISPSIYNISTLEIFSASVNLLYGHLPANLGEILPHLKVFYIGENKFTGTIPISLSNASELKVIDLSRNNFQGKVPNDLGRRGLSNLQILNIEHNLLGTNSTGDLSFIASLTNCTQLQELILDENNLGGELPSYLVNLTSKLTKLLIGSNHIMGRIPVGIGILANLISLGLEWNCFSGTIPSDFGRFRKLQGLSLEHNRLSGQLPSSFCNISSLNQLFLSHNRIEGNIPITCLGKFKQLREINISKNNFKGIITSHIFGENFSPIEFDLSLNSFTGSFPFQIGSLIHISELSAFSNKFSGEIPRDLGSCQILELLAMQGNLFTGEIPNELTRLKNIQHLDLSANHLTGEIPSDLEKLPFLIYLNLSFNNLVGEIPTGGVFSNATQIMLYGNSKLCGGIPELKFPPCPTRVRNKKSKPLLAILLPTMIFFISVTIISTATWFYLVVRKKRHKRKEQPLLVLNAGGILRISYHDLHRATTGFSIENLIGSGSYGTVYKGTLDLDPSLHRKYNKLEVAVKVLDLQKTGASKTFKAECRALRNISHRNLVPLLTYCSTIDFKGQDFKALVYEYMENGNLDMWLHDPTTRNLNLLQRLNIAIDVASALHYLHNQSDIRAIVIHRDMKPSNILLDHNLTAHLGDFGLARLLPKAKATASGAGESSEETTTIAVKGSLGYAAPEYGMGVAASTEGDVYSFGILLMEMFTGRRPTDSIFLGDNLESNLHNYVKKNLHERILLLDIVDSSLLDISDHQPSIDERNQDCLILIFKIGLKCSAYSPKERMNMNDVVRELHHIKDRYINVGLSRRHLM